MFNIKKIILAGILIFTAFAFVSAPQKETQAQEEVPVVSSDATVATGGGNNQAGAEILALLADLKSVRLDDSIFSDPMFQSLQDLSVSLLAEPVGRPNPFAPLGKDVVLDESAPGFATSSPRNIPFSSIPVGNKTNASASSNTSPVPPPIPVKK